MVGLAFSLMMHIAKVGSKRADSQGGSGGRPALHMIESKSGEQAPLRRPAILEDMVLIAGGTFRMGSNRHYPEEAPVHSVTVSPFWIDPAPVTNRQFRKFINATSYVTVAERPPDAKDYPGALPHMLKAGSLVFAPPKQVVNLNDWSQWWRFKFGRELASPLWAAQLD
jgi:formylglycine-generating enzyme